MTQFSIEEIYEEVGKIVKSFSLLQCDKCALAVIAWLNKNKIAYKIIRLKTRYDDEDFIISERLERQGITESITVNGNHYGVEIQGRVFDNLSSEGMLRDDWVNDFHCPSEEFNVEEIEEL